MYSTYQERSQNKTSPAIRITDTRHRIPAANIGGSARYSAQSTQIGSQRAVSGKDFGKDLLGSIYRPSSTIRKDERIVTDHKEVRTYTPGYSSWKNTETQQKTIPERKKTEVTSSSTVSFSKQSTHAERSDKDIKADTKPRISENLRTKPNFSKFPTYELNTNSKPSVYEETITETQTTVKEKRGGSKPTEESKSLTKEKDKLEKQTKEEKRKVDEKTVVDERSVNFGRQTDAKMGIEQKKYVREEVINQKVAGSEISRTLKNESSKKDTDVSFESKSREVIEIPISLERPAPDEVSQKNNKDISSQDFKTSIGRETGDRETKPAEIHKVSVSESNLRDEERTSGRSHKMETLSTENIAENIVADILKSFTQSSSSEVSTDTKVTSFSKQKQGDDGKIKTEMTVQSRVQENIDVSAEAGRGSLSNQDVRKVLESAEGTPSKQEIEDIVHHGLKGSGDAKNMSVNVEIVEETVDYATDERTDFSTPFEVEEVEDTFPEKEKRYGDEEQDITFTYEDLKKRKQRHESFTHVEEVTEEDDSPIEQKYFVSVPDDHPIINEKDDDSVYGQIHIEEESTIKYSWQDEFLQGTQSKRDEGVSSPEETYRVVGEEATAHILKEEHPKAGTSHVESVVIEKEIKIPQEFQASIKGLLSKETKDPKQQLKEALEQLEGSLPESVKEELSALTKESQADSSNLEFDIKKVHQTEEGGLLTIVAEVNLSQTLNADEFNVAELSEVIAGEKKTSSHSLKRDKLERVDGKISTETDVSAHSDIYTPVANEEVYRSSTVRKSGSTGYHTTEKVIYDGSVLETAHFGEDSHSPESTDESESVRHIWVGPTEVQRFEQIAYEGPGSEMLSATEDVVQTEGSSEMSHSVKHFKLGPKEIQTTEEVIYRGPITTTVEEMDSGNLSQQTFSSDISRSTRHVTVGSRQVIEEVSFEGPGSDSLELNSSGNLSQTEEVSRSVRQFRLHPKEIHSEQVIFEGPISGKVEISDSRDFSQMESSVRHIQLGPKEFMTAEKVIYQGPITEHIEISEVGDQTHSESSVRHFRLGQTGVKTTERIIYQGSLSETPELMNMGHLSENEGSSDISTSFRHVRITPVETQSEQIIFTRPTSETLEDHSQTRESSESSSSMKHVKVGSSETSFTFQMDVSNAGGVSMAESEEQATMLIPNKQDPSVNQSQFRVESDHSGDSENKGSYIHSSFSQDHVENIEEKSGFDKTVQLQRMVDQRSVISDEKKVALLYLDHEEEDDEENDGQWF